MTLLVFILLLFLHGLISRKLEGTLITAPILFTAAGFSLEPVLKHALSAEHQNNAFLHLAEIGLVMLLFADASRTDLRLLKSIRNLAVRLLSFGMLLTIVLGALIALWVFPHLTIWEAGILAAILAPTDAGLGQIIVNSPLVPQRIRQSLNVEAGLNDGLSVPFLLFFMSLAVINGDHDKALGHFVVEQLGYGALLGAGLGLFGGWFVHFAIQRNWMADGYKQITVVVIPVLCLLLSEPIGASMFIAAFVAGLFVQVGFKEAGKHSIEFTEEWGQVLNLSVFFLFGMLTFSFAGEMHWSYVLYAILSLTIVRMLPVALALSGTGLQTSTKLFMGWFGPRGLASIVLGLVFLEEELHIVGESTIRLAVITTVLLSIFAHGFSAAPGIQWYRRKLAAAKVEE